MNRRPGIAVIVIGFLVVLGAIYQFAKHTVSFLIPLIVFGTIFLLWKFPPSTWKRGVSSRTGGTANPRQAAARRKAEQKAKFKVIQGNKGKLDEEEEEEEEEETPKYH